MQQINGGLLGVTPGEMQQLTVMAGLVIPKALISLGLSATGLNMNGFTGKLVVEGSSVVMSAVSMMASHYFFTSPKTNCIENKESNIA